MLLSQAEGAYSSIFHLYSTVVMWRKKEEKSNKAELSVFETQNSKEKLLTL